MNLSEHFTLAEARCNCGCDMPVQIQSAARVTAVYLMEPVRAVLGEPLHVNSWYRCPEWNKHVGGAEHSEHLEGFAVDFTCKGLTPAQVRAKLVAAGLLRGSKVKGNAPQCIGGMGAYKGFTHVDRRTNSPAVRWTG